MAKEEKPKRSLRIFDVFFLMLALSPVILPFVIIDQPELPDGGHCASEWVSVSDTDVELLIDSTAWDPARKQRVIHQEIFDELLDMIARADQFIVLDIFLWNHFQGTIIEDHRKLSLELALALIKKKQVLPDLPIVLLTDPINRIYDDMAPTFFKELEDAGVKVVFTYLWDLPDSNWIYGTNARFYSRFTPNPNKETALANKPWVTNPLIVDGPKISLKQLGNLLFFKANHRKVAITASQKDGVDLLVSSLNPADGSSAHSNIGIRVRGALGLEALDSELKLITWSHEAAFPETLLPEEIDRIKVLASKLPASAPGSVRVKWITEGAIHKSLIDLLNGASIGDEVMITLFYLSDREVIAAIKQAAKNGAKVRMVLDANRDAFGREKSGIPNRIVAGEFRSLAVENNISIVWADTHGEQFHNKALAISNPRTGKNHLCLGSANWTRRNLADLNLEANVWMEGSQLSMDRFTTYFETLWKNTPSLSYTLDFSAWEETGWKAKFKGLLYRVQEWTGLSTF
jgi:phosphatidylserine/phosphatidylglycerophosphate/cardiolipin synthase-like enzyme